jgi:hypothetical protein
MRWFKHFSDAYSNIKHQQIIAEVGLSGYGFYWILVELIAQQGINNRIKSDKKWRKLLEFVTRCSEQKVTELLQLCADVNLIDKEGLEMGDLFIPKMAEYSDEYTEKKRRVSRQAPDSVGKEENRREENKTEVEEKKTYGQFFRVLLSDDQFQKLVEGIGENNTALLIEELDGYIESTGKKYLSHYATLLNWGRKKYREGKEKIAAKKPKVII